jgi:purine-binding chemotaxis protein CheW
MTATLNVPLASVVGTTELIAFRLNGLLLGIDILHVKEINCQLQHTPVPCAVGDVCGVINLRGEVLTVIDLGQLLHLSAVAKQGPARYVIVASEKERIALLVDAIEDVVTLDRGELKPIPANFRNVRKEALQGVYPLTNELLIVLDVDNALSLKDEAIVA